MYVVGHQAVCENFKLMLFAVASQPLKIGLIVLIDEKNGLTSIASLRNVMG
jgi:hypothetical protein